SAGAPRCASLQCTQSHHRGGDTAMLDSRLAVLAAVLLLLAPGGAASQTASGGPCVQLVGVGEGQTVSGVIAVEARVTGSGIARVEFRIDGRYERREYIPRYCLA